MKKKILVTIPILFLFGTIVLSIVGSVRATKLVDLNKKLAELENRNKELSEKLILGSSLSQAALQSESMGFIPSKTVVYIAHESEVAQAR